MQETIDDPPEFTDEEMRQALKRMGQKARQETFAAGLPVAFVRGNQLILQYPDGREEVAETFSNGNGQKRDGQ